MKYSLTEHNEPKTIRVWAIDKHETKILIGAVLPSVLGCEAIDYLGTIAPVPEDQAFGWVVQRWEEAKKSGDS